MDNQVINAAPTNQTEPVAQPKKHSSRSALDTTIIILCILIPFLGALGIHDFIVGRKKEGEYHILMSLLSCLSVFAMMLAMLCDAGCSSGIGAIISLLSIAGMIMSFLALASYIWGLVECVMIFSGKYDHNKI